MALAQFKLRSQSVVMILKRDHIVGIILAISCLTGYSANIGIVKLDRTSHISRYLMRFAKSVATRNMLSPQGNECRNFYEYACGGWPLRNKAHNTYFATNSFQALDQAYEKRLESFLSDFNNATADKLTRQVRDFYVSCLLVEADHISDVLHLENIYRSFYYDSKIFFSGVNWIEEADLNWWQTIADIQLKYGKQILLAVDNTSSGITIGKPKFMKPLDFSKIVNDLFDFFGSGYEFARRMASEMKEFERKIMEMELEDRLVVKQLNELDIDGFIVRKFLEAVLGNAEEVPNEINLNENYIRNILNTIRSTSNRTLANYILLQFLQEYMVDGTLKDLPINCQNVTRKFFSKYLDFAIYKTYRNDEMENDVQNMFEEIRETFRDTLDDKLDWVSNSSRSYALEKLSAMSLQFQPYDDIDFDEIYANLSVNRQDYVENLRNLMNKFKEPATDNPTSPYATVYNVDDNSIFIPVALLPSRFLWDKNYPQAIKYATLGYLIAHEMIRGFDDEGRHYDMHGNKSDWWDKKSTHEFEARAKCFSAQYQDYRREGFPNFPETISQSHVIADNAAIRLAYRAYISWIDKQLPLDANIEQKETLPGLTFDNRQLFFVSFAQLWCTDEQKLFKLPPAAAPNQYRVNGPLTNFQEFSWIFKCRPSARMDPSCKCVLY